jgi:dihydroneopterin aldolase
MATKGGIAAGSGCIKPFCGAEGGFSDRFMRSFPLADARQGRRHMFIRNLVLPARIGVHPHEHAATQRIRINLDLAIDEAYAGESGTGKVGPDELARVVDYEQVVNQVRAAVAASHVRLAETLAERLAVLCLTDARVAVARVRVEKLDIFADAEAAGVEIERRRPGRP